MFRKLFAIETAALVQLDDDSRYGDTRTAHLAGADTAKVSGLPLGFASWKARTSF